MCETLRNRSIRLNEIEIVLFQPFKPMLSKRCDVETVQSDIKNADFYYIEVKFDGERFQLHYRNGEFKYYSRYVLPIGIIVDLKSSYRIEI